MASTQIPNDLLELDLTTKQLLEIMDIRRRKSVLANRLIAWPKKEAAVKEAIVKLQEEEDAMVNGKGGA